MKIWTVKVHALCHMDRNNNVLNGADKSWVTEYTREDNNFLEAKKSLGGNKPLLPSPCWLVHSKGRHIIPPRGRAAVRASLYLQRRQQMTTRLADIRHWSRKQVTRPLGPALCWLHSPKLMSDMHSTALTKLWLWRRPWSQNRRKVSDWPAEKK